MYLIEALTKEAEQWIEDNVCTEPWQWLGDNLAVDHHFVYDICVGMQEAGLTFDDVEVAHA